MVRVACPLRLFAVIFIAVFFKRLNGKFKEFYAEEFRGVFKKYGYPYDTKKAEPYQDSAFSE
jgi:hypothetical protein